MGFGSSGSVQENNAEVIKYLDDLDISFFRTHIKWFKSVCFADRYMQGILLDNDVNEREMPYIITHELMHLANEELYEFDTPRRKIRACENRVKSMTIHKFISVFQLISAFRESEYISLEILSNYFGTTKAIILEILNFYFEDSDFMKFMIEFREFHDLEYLNSELEKVDREYEEI